MPFFQSSIDLHVDPMNCHTRANMVCRSLRLQRHVHHWRVASAGITKVQFDGTRDQNRFWCCMVSWLLGSGCTLPPLQLKMAISAPDQLGDLFVTTSSLPALRSWLVSLACCTRNHSVPNILTLTRLTKLQLSVKLGRAAHAAWKLPALRQLELVRCEGSLNALLENGAMPQLKGLSAVSCSFSVEILTSLAQFTTLRELALRKCGLQQLPELAALQRLRFLDLSENASLENLEPALALTMLTCLVFEGGSPLDSSFVHLVEKLPAVSLVWIEGSGLRTSLEYFDISCLSKVMSSRSGSLYAADSRQISDADRLAGGCRDE